MAVPSEQKSQASVKVITSHCSLVSKDSVGAHCGAHDVILCWADLWWTAEDVHFAG